MFIWHVRSTLWPICVDAIYVKNITKKTWNMQYSLHVEGI